MSAPSRRTSHTNPRAPGLRAQRPERAHPSPAWSHQTRAQGHRAPCYRDVCPMDAPSSDAPLNSYTSSRGTLLFVLLWVVPRIRTAAQDLVPNRMLHPFNHAAHSLGAQPDAGQRGNLAGAHPLPEIEPEDRPVTLPIRPAQAMLQMFIDLAQKELE